MTNDPSVGPERMIAVVVASSGVADENAKLQKLIDALRVMGRSEDLQLITDVAALCSGKKNAPLDAGMLRNVINRRDWVYASNPLDVLDTNGDKVADLHELRVGMQKFVAEEAARGHKVPRGAGHKDRNSWATGWGEQSH